MAAPITMYVKITSPITEVKMHWAWLVLKWVTVWEHHVSLALFFLFSNFFFSYNFFAECNCIIDSKLGNFPSFPNVDIWNVYVNIDFFNTTISKCWFSWFSVLFAVSTNRCSKRKFTYQTHSNICQLILSFGSAHLSEQKNRMLK